MPPPSGQFEALHKEFSEASLGLNEQDGTNRNELIIELATFQNARLLKLP